MAKELEVNLIIPGEISPATSPIRRDVQGEALQMNDNSVGGKKPARSPGPTVADKPNSPKVQGKALQVNENSV